MLSIEPVSECLPINGQVQRFVPAKWNTLSLTGGVGWDFPISRELKFRPIFNFSLGGPHNWQVEGSKKIGWNDVIRYFPVAHPSGHHIKHAVQN